jgi:hypothetical protein
VGIDDIPEVPEAKVFISGVVFKVRYSALFCLVILSFYKHESTVKRRAHFSALELPVPANYKKFPRGKKIGHFDTKTNSLLIIRPNYIEITLVSILSTRFKNCALVKH